MQIEKKDIRPGDFLIFKRAAKDRLAFILSLLIRLFYADWDRWGWHMAVVMRRNEENCTVLEAAWPVVRLNDLSSMDEYKAYRWLEKEPETAIIEAFVKTHAGLPYDVKKYLFTFLYGILRHFKINLGKWEDDNYYCWELAEEFAECLGKPFTTRNETLLLPDIQKELEK
jgi:hypothetical protein